MKTLPIITSVAVATGLFVSVAAAQNSPAPVVTPSTPAPVVAMPSTPAPAVGAARPAAERTIYVPSLPSASELTEIAKAQGVAIQQIDQTANDVTIVYRFNDGRTSTVAYQLLPDGATPAPPPANASVVTGRTTPSVVYYTPAPTTRVVYYDRSVYYDPFYYPWYGPVALSVGFGLGYHSNHWGGHGHWGGGHWSGGHWGGGHHGRH